LNGGLAQAFDEIAVQFADHTALRDSKGPETYKQLQVRSHRLAAALNEQGLTKGLVCAFLMPRGGDAIALMIAIARLGAISVPLDPSYPPRQLETIIGDCAPRLIVTGGDLSAAPLPFDAKIVAFDRLTSDALMDVTPVSSEDAAQIMYTSGSTGTPKGVVVPHRGIMRLVRTQSFLAMTPRTIFLNLAPLAFDASTLEIWAPLLNGGCAVIINDLQPSLDTIVDEITRLKANTAWFTAGLFNALADYHIEAFAPLSDVLTGGDVLSPLHVRKVLDTYPALRLINGYGPTENTTFTCCHIVTRQDLDGPIPIGKPITGTTIHVLDPATLAPVEDGQVGELFTGGQGLALGYLNRAELTAEKFVPPLLKPIERLYRTGDLVRRRPDGVLEFLGRNDRQVKISGKRVELDEIEHVLRTLPGIADAAVGVTTHGDIKRIAAFVRSHETQASINALLPTVLPEHMIPAELVVLTEFPLTPNGKVDRKTLMTRSTVRPAAVIDQNLTDRLASVFEALLGASVDRDRNFFELGLRSLDLMKAHAQLRRELAPNLLLPDLFAHSTVNALARLLQATAPVSTQPKRATQGDAIAIIGMAGRFPGAKTPAELWANILAGQDSISRFTDDELEDNFDDATRRDARYIKARPILEDVDRFDAGFFSMMAREAALTDPQQRVFLQIAWEAFEDAGYDPAGSIGDVGVFAGTSMNTYFLHHVLSDRRRSEDFTSQFQTGAYPELMGAGDFVATRTAYKLGLTGPAVSVQTACSTSLTAVAQAVQSLRLGQCDMALAGGVSITFPQKRGYIYEEGGIGSADGTCRPFDARACGTVFGSGAGAVLLKRLEDAISDDDTVYAVIRGIGLSNDGALKAGFTAPSAEGQARAISAALTDARVDADTIGYIEAHGTATPLGDPIEFTGLVKAFDSKKRGNCALGSVKANIGHLDAAAGVTGLIAATLAVHHRTLPPLRHFTAANPHIDFTDSPFYVNTKPRAWTGASRRAGVSSFGVGGTNVHLVLEEAPERMARPSATDQAHVLPLSARSPEALNRQKTHLARHLAAHPDIDLRDVALTLQTGRRAFACRTAVSAASLVQAIKALDGHSNIIQTDASPAPVVFMFAGQGAQYPGMGRTLYAQEPVYRQWIDAGASILRGPLGLDIRDLLLTETSAEDDTLPIRTTVFAQPALFLTQYALAKLWISRGVRPDAMIGHSVGELVCACLAEAIGFEDALTLISSRGALMQSMPGGAMLAVRLSEADLRACLPAALDIAALNAPALSVVAGSFDAIAAFEAELDARDIGHSRLHTSHAFHSRMMTDAVAGLEAIANGFHYSVPKIPYVSSVTGAWASDTHPPDGRYWAEHCRETVRFAQALDCVTSGRKPILLEAGPGRTLATFARQGLARDRYLDIISSLPDFAHRAEEAQTLAIATGQLWANGIDIAWASLPSTQARRIPLPFYAFEPERHWIEAPASRPESAASIPSAISIASPIPSSEMVAISMTIDRTPRLTADLIALLGELSGETPDLSNPDTTFWDLGYDSLFMGQVAQQLRRRHGVKVTFRQIMADFPTVPALVHFIDSQLPPEAATQPAPEAAPAAQVTAALPLLTQPPLPQTSTIQPPVSPAPASGDLHAVIRDQLATLQTLMQHQLEAVRGTQIATPPAFAATSSIVPATTAETTPRPPEVATEKQPDISAEAARPTRFNAYRPGTASTQMTEAQKTFIADLSARYSERTPLSKARTQSHRKVLADPRTASGFREEWKELVYPVVAARSKGSKIWDIDGNEYVDLVNGYGQTAFGHTPDFVVDAVKAQMDEGFAIGPQSPLAGEVAELFAAMTGHERVTFCNTGSEAVMAAMRLARTVTGKEKVVCFDGDYHGQFDEVLVKPGNRAGIPQAFPLAPGIPASSVSNMVVLPYAKPDSLEWIKAHIDDIAAVLIEPVQSRHPSLRPREFVQALRNLTEANDTALIIDEVVTGFRVHPAGMQGYWGIQGDMATYGKVVGGGLPVGVLAGSARFMDALDGGQWQFGDASVPEVAPTFFAGTFVRHPVVLSAMKAVLTHLNEAGPALQVQLGGRMEALVARLNGHLASAGIATRLETFSSWFYVNFGAEDRLGSLFYAHMRLLGIHIMEGFPCFLTTSHSDADIARIEEAFVATIEALRGAGIFGGEAHSRPFVAPAAETLPLNEAPQTAPLTEPQKEIWMSAQLGDEASLAFNESFTLEMEGTLDEAAFEQAFASTVARHDALRTSFSRIGDAMVARPADIVTLESLDLRDSSDAGAQLQALIAQEARTPFDLTQAPLVRAKLVRTTDTHWAFIFTAHHIICDGWSCNIILRDLQALYTAAHKGTTADLEEVQSFLAFAVAETAAGTDEDTRRFWLDLHRSPAPLLELPSDRARPDLKSFRGATTTHQIGQTLLKAIKKTSAGQACSLFATLLGAAQVLFGRLSNQDDVVIAAPMAGQSQAGDALLVGHCVNFLPLRVAFDPDRSFADHMKAVRDHVLDASDHQNYTFGALVRDLALKRGLNRLPLTDLQFNLEKIEGELDMAGVRTRFAPNAKAFTNFDLFLNVIESAEGLRLDCDYSTDLYDEATIQRWLGHYESLLSAIAEAPDTAIRALPILSPAEVTWLRDDLNASRQPYDLSQTTLALIAAQAGKAPEAPAVRDARDHLTYKGLMERASHIARRLVAAGIRPGQRVAIAMDRTVTAVAAMIAVWQAGAAYVPLDIAQPAGRLIQVLEAADIAGVLSDTEGRVHLSASPFRMFEVETLLAAPDDAVALPTVTDADSAYVIFTSGSTGTPKGVEISHRALTNFLLSMAETPGFTAIDTIAAVTTFSFDISGLELFLPLISGGQVFVMAHDEVRDGYALVKRLNQEAVTVLQATPSLWRLLVEAGFKAPEGFKILCGGEALPRDLADALLSTGAELWNLYGPTETTIWSSAGRVAADGPIVIGSPLANTQLHVLTEDMRLAPVGVSGDLWIGGAGLAKGYLNRADLTEAAFRMIALEGAAPERLYRTGDIARRLNDGRIQHLGRSDHQVKLRGFRIEIEEIEIALRKAPGVTAAAVALQTIGNDPRLVGYVVTTTGEAADFDALARHAGDILPAYMVPGAWLQMAALPQTANGKLDRKALPEPVSETVRTPANAAPQALPMTSTEALIRAIWCDVLGLVEIEPDQPFFGLGADSLQLFRIVARLNEKGLPVDARQLMKNVSIRELAALLDDTPADNPPRTVLGLAYADETVVGIAPARPVSSRPSIRDFKRSGAHRSS
jgi:amino acid adenylation domain-containing protein